jgi:hypothetical protein
MSLREALRAAVAGRVAGCTPLEMQHATIAPEDATGDATSVQQPPANPRQSLLPAATGDATGVQPGSCTPPATTPPNATRKLHDLTPESRELHVALTSACNTQPGALTRHRLTAALVEAIGKCCDVRGDDDTNRAALLADAAELPVHLQADLLAHFTVEAARYGRPTDADSRVRCTVHGCRRLTLTGWCERHRTPRWTDTPPEPVRTDRERTLSCSNARPSRATAWQRSRRRRPPRPSKADHSQKRCSQRLMACSAERLRRW